MKETLRSLVAGTVGALVVAAVVVGQPALANQLEKTAAKNSVTSKSIKNGTVKGKDLAADVNASLAKANTALQSVPDGSVTTSKLASSALAGYSATQSGSQDITANTSFTTIISKSLPAGTFMVSGKALLSADNTDNAQAASEQCRLNTGSATDVAQVVGPTGTVFLFHRNVGTVSMALPVTGPVTVTLQCKNDLTAPPAGWALSVSQAKIIAVQTSSNN
jgi:hypothetical protein